MFFTYFHLGTNVFIIFAWLVERATVRGLVGGKFAMVLIGWNLFCLLTFPTIMILSMDFSPCTLHINDL